MTDLVLDASLTLQWFLEDEADREYSLGVLANLAKMRAQVPVLWFYEVGNGLLMAHRRRRISMEQVETFLLRLNALPIDPAAPTPSEVLELPVLAQLHGLTNYDAAYLGLALRANLPLATTDADLRRAATQAGLKIFQP